MVTILLSIALAPSAFSATCARHQITGTIVTVDPEYDLISLFTVNVDQTDDQTAARGDIIYRDPYYADLGSSVWKIDVSAMVVDDNSNTARIVGELTECPMPGLVGNTMVAVVQDGSPSRWGLFIVDGSKDFAIEHLNCFSLGDDSTDGNIRVF